MPILTQGATNSLSPFAASLKIGKRTIGPGSPVYVIAELSANHHQDFDQALKLVRAAKDCGADAVKLQTYTPDTITMRSDREYFRVGGGTIWDGETLHDLYSKAYTPWEWQPQLKVEANFLDLDLFSSPFDVTAVDFLEKMQVPAYKVASFELVDVQLIKRIAITGKPILMSIGMATETEISEALQTAAENGATQVALLKCTSAYPALPGDMNLRTIPEIAERFGVPAGLSDHTPGSAVAVTAVALGACIVEKHLTLSRAEPGPDSKFSMEPDEFAEMVAAIRVAEQALGSPSFGPGEHEKSSLAFRRSLFVVKNVERGQRFTAENVRSIRPANGLHTRYLTEILGKRARRDIEAGTPLSWDEVENA